MNRESMVRHINRQRQGRSWTRFAADMGLGVPELHMTAKGKRPPSPKVLAKFGYERVDEYRQVTR